MRPDHEACKRFLNVTDRTGMLVRVKLRIFQLQMDFVYLARTNQPASAALSPLEAIGTNHMTIEEEIQVL